MYIEYRLFLAVRIPYHSCLILLQLTVSWHILGPVVQMCILYSWIWVWILLMSSRVRPTRSGPSHRNFGNALTCVQRKRMSGKQSYTGFCVFEASPLIPLFGNEVLDWIFVPKSENGREREEVIGGWRKLYTQNGPKVSKKLNKMHCLFIYLFLARQPPLPRGPGPPHSQGF
jgi:hypothetical protein